MSVLTSDLLRELVAESRFAPSVHNIQPTRWRALPEGRLALVDDKTVRAPVADASGHDVRISHGAALEGMCLALNRRGLSAADVMIGEQSLSPQYTALCTMTVRAGAACDRLREGVSRRMSWRGTFTASPEDEASLRQLAAARDDAVVIRDRAEIAEIATWADAAEYSFLRSTDHRRELLHWMRLSPSHPLYRENGLNREALAMSGIEATGARVVLGPLFPLLDKLGLAPSLVSDRAKTSSAAAIVLFTRPEGEDPFVSGRNFYRVWLEIDRAGFAACPISALADHAGFNGKLRVLGRVADGKRLVNVFRIGRPSRQQSPRHFRLPVDQLIV